MILNTHQCVTLFSECNALSAQLQFKTRQTTHIYHPTIIKLDSVHAHGHKYGKIAPLLLH